MRGQAWLAVLGLVAWIATTVLVAATNDDPSDGRPILRAFAFGGAVFFTAVLGAAARQVRQRTTAGAAHLYLRLVVAEPDPGAVRAATRGTAGIAGLYLAFAGVSTGLFLIAVGLGDGGPWEIVLLAGVAVVVVWAVVAVWAIGRSFGAADTVLGPLGLAVSEIPGWVAKPSGGGSLVGSLRLAGTRHGRPISIAQRPKEAVTTIGGRYDRRTLRSPGAMAELTGEPAGEYRGVEVAAGGDGVVVHRRGNGAGRHLLHDLLLAEAIAGCD